MNRYENETDVIKAIEGYMNQGYEGYVQFSAAPIDAKCVFKKSNATQKFPTDKEGFISEAHFCNSETSITIRRINAAWYIDKTDLSCIVDEAKDIQTYHSKHGHIKMAQIWQEEKDDFCEGMNVLKLKKVVFAGFEDAR